MKDIIVSYDEASKKVIDDMDSIKQFKSDLNEQINSINSFKANKSALYKMIHPVKLIRNCKEEKRLKKIESTYNRLYDACILQYVIEESGDLQVDLDNAAYRSKPRFINNYVKALKLKK